MVMAAGMRTFLRCSSQFGLVVKVPIFLQPIGSCKVMPRTDVQTVLVAALSPFFFFTKCSFVLLIVITNSHELIWPQTNPRNHSRLSPAISSHEIASIVLATFNVSRSCGSGLGLLPPCSPIPTWLGDCSIRGLGQLPRSKSIWINDKLHSLCLYPFALKNKSVSSANRCEIPVCLEHALFTSDNINMHIWFHLCYFPGPVGCYTSCLLCL